MDEYIVVVQDEGYPSIDNHAFVMRGGSTLEVYDTASRVLNRLVHRHVLMGARDFHGPRVKLYGPYSELDTRPRLAPGVGVTWHDDARRFDDDLDRPVYEVWAREWNEPSVNAERYLETVDRAEAIALARGILKQRLAYEAWAKKAYQGLDPESERPAPPIGAYVLEWLRLVGYGMATVIYDSAKGEV